TVPTGGRAPAAGGPNELFQPAAGPGARLDRLSYARYPTRTPFDSLLAKVIVHTPSPRLADAVSKAYRALSEFRIIGLPTNIPFLQNVLRHHAFDSGALHTRMVEENLDALLPDAAAHKALFVTPERQASHAGVRVDT